MSLCKRAYLYIGRKWGKSIIIFLIMLIVSTMALLGISLKRASDKAALDLRMALGGSFGITIDKTKSDNFNSLEDGGQGVKYTGKPLDKSVIDQVMKSEEIKKSNAYMSGEAIVKNKDGNYMDLIKTNNRYDEDEKLLHTSSLEGNTSSEKSKYFLNETLALTDGNPITDQDKNVALISEEFAEMNKLDIGDHFFLELDDIEIEVIVQGIFQIKEPQLNIAAAPPASLHYNRIFLDLHSLEELNQNKSYGRLDFWIKDPSKLDLIIDEVLANKKLDWDSYKVDKNEADYQKAVKPLMSMNSLLNYLLLIIIISCISILILILNLWMRSRIYETGVYLSVGISKGKILLQRILEVTSIAVLAFICAIVLSKSAGDITGEYLLSQYKVSEELENEEAEEVPNLSLDIRIETNDVIWITATGLVLSAAAVTISSASLFRYKPKEILTKMS